jgi:hypothetical protein
VKKLLAIMSLLSFVAVLAAGSAVAEDYSTVCIPQKGDGADKKNATYKRVADGLNPGSPCKSKQLEATLVKKPVTDDLQGQIDDNFDDIVDNALDIADNASDIADNESNIADNADMIDSIKAGLISSMIGGGHNSTIDGTSTFWMPLYNWWRGTSEPQVRSKVSVTGWLTKLSVIVNSPTGAGAAQFFQYVIDGTPVDLSPAVTNNFCVIGGDSDVMCESSGCVEIDMGQTLSVQVNAVDSGGTPQIDFAKWTGRFVETDADCPVL